MVVSEPEVSSHPVLTSSGSRQVASVIVGVFPRACVPLSLTELFTYYEWVIH